MGLEGPPNHPVSNTRAFCVNLNKQQLLVKTESDPFVNERPVYNTKESFVKESTDGCLWLISLYISQHFIKIFAKDLGFNILYKYVLSSSAHRYRYIRRIDIDNLEVYNVLFIYLYLHASNCILFTLFWSWECMIFNFLKKVFGKKLN